METSRLLSIPLNAPVGEVRRVMCGPDRTVIYRAGDHFFDVEWARWLCRTIPGARDLVELPGAKLFFPFERPARLAVELRRLWADGAAIR